MVGSTMSSVGAASEGVQGSQAGVTAAKQESVKVEVDQGEAGLGALDPDSWGHEAAATTTSTTAPKVPYHTRPA